MLARRGNERKIFLKAYPTKAINDVTWWLTQADICCNESVKQELFEIKCDSFIDR